MKDLTLKPKIFSRLNLVVLTIPYGLSRQLGVVYV